MKRLAAFAVVVALSALPASPQRGGSHGGFSGSHSGSSGSHGGFSSPHSGFSGSHSGFSGRAPAFHAPAFQRGSGTVNRGGFGGVRALPPARYAGPSQPISHRVPYPGPGVRHVGPVTASPRQLNSGSMHRLPYHSPYGGGGEHRGNTWDHRGWNRDRDRDRDRGRFRFSSVYLWGGYPFWPGWGWGYPYLPNYWDDSGDYDSQPASNYATGGPSYPEYAPGPYDAGEADSAQSQQPPWPYSRPAPSADPPATASAPPAPEAPVTLVFKDGRPNEQIHNYLMTATTLSVLDQRHRDIPVDQIDLSATARLNREAGIEFSIPAIARSAAAGR